MIRTRQVHSFARGMRTDIPADLLGPGESPLVQNYDPSLHPYAAVRRNGYVNDSVAMGLPTGSQGTSGIFVWKKPGTTTYYFLLAEGNKLYTWATGGGAFTDITPAGGIWAPVMDTEVYFAALGSIVVIAAKGSGVNHVPCKWDGTSVTALGGTPPADMWRVVAHQGRIFGLRNVTGQYQNIVWSKLGDPENYTAADDASADANGLLPQPVGEGEPLTGLLSAGPVLYIFSDRAVYMLLGQYDALGFSFQKLCPYGLAAPFGLTAFDGVPIWASYDACYALAGGGRRVGFFTTRMFPTYRDIADKRQIALLTYKDQVWIVYPNTNNQYRLDTAIVNRVREGKWVQYTGNMEIRAVYSYVDSAGKAAIAAGTAPTAGGNVVRARLLDSGTTDAGSAISTVLETKDIAMAGRMGHIDRWNFATEASPSTITIKRYLDRTLLSGTLTAKIQLSTGQSRFQAGGTGEPKKGFLWRLRFEESTVAAGVGKFFDVNSEESWEPELALPV